jgi:uncharacterized lipoprotein YmbA
MLNKALTGFIGATTGALLSACAATPATHFYVLSAARPVAPMHSETTAESLIGIGPISLPTLLERKQIITRTDNNGVQIAEFHQWAAPLKDTVIQVITQNIAQQLPNSLVRSYPWNAFGTVKHHLIINISRLDTQLGKSANLEATWAIMEDKNHKLISNGHATIERPLIDSSYPATVLALSDILGDFSQQLAAELKKVE